MSVRVSSWGYVGRPGRRAIGALAGAVAIAAGLGTASPSVAQASAPKTVSAASAPGSVESLAGGNGNGVPTEVTQSFDALAVDRVGAVYSYDRAFDRVRALTKTGAQRVILGGGTASPLAIPVSGMAASAVDLEALANVDLDVDANGVVLLRASDYDKQASWYRTILAVPTVSVTAYGIPMVRGKVYRLLGGTNYSDTAPLRDRRLYGGADLAVHPSGVLLFGGALGTAFGCRMMALPAQATTFAGQAMAPGTVYDVPGLKVEDACGKLAVDSAGTVAMIGDRASLWSFEGGDMFGVHLNPGVMQVLGATPGPAAATTFDRFGNLVVSPPTGKVTVIARSAGRVYGTDTVAGSTFTVRWFPGTAVRVTSAPDGTLFGASGDISDDPAYLGRLFLRSHRTITGRTWYGQTVAAGQSVVIAGTGGAFGHDPYPIDKTTGQIRPWQSAGNPQGAIAMTIRERVASGWRTSVAFIPPAAGQYFGQDMLAGRIYEVWSLDGQECTGLALNDEGLTCRVNGTVRFLAAHDTTAFGHALGAGESVALAPSGGFGPMAFDADGNILHIASTSPYQVLRVIAQENGLVYGRTMLAGLDRILAGGLALQTPVMGGPATDSGLIDVTGVVPDAQGHVLIFDTKPHVGESGLASMVQVLAAQDGTAYGQEVVAGNVYGVTPGLWGVPSPDIDYSLDVAPDGMAIDTQGHLILPGAFSKLRTRILPTSDDVRYGLSLTAGQIVDLARRGSPIRVGDDIVLQFHDSLARLAS